MPRPTDGAAPVGAIDLTGEVCPMTFVKAELQLDRMASGETLEIVLKAAGQVRSVPQSLRDEGHRIESVRREGDRYHLVVRRGEVGATPP